MIDKPNPNQSIKEKLKLETNFEPKYDTDSTAYKRKIIEFSGKVFNKHEKNEELKNINSSLGYLQSEKNDNFNKKLLQELTVQEKSLLQNNPLLTIDQVKQKAIEMRNNKLNHINEIENERKQKLNGNPFEIVLNSLQSNIFHIKKKPLMSISFNSNLKKERIEKKEEEGKEKNEEGVRKVKPKCDLEGWSGKIDWKTIDSERHFRKDKNDEYKVKNMKRKEQLSSINFCISENNCDDSLNVDERLNNTINFNSINDRGK